MAKHSIAALDGLRCVAALLVIIGHVVLWKISPDAGLPAYEFLARFAYLGMSLFFVLSGFVIHLNYAVVSSGNKRELSRFAIARFSRLYPLYLFVLLCEFAASGVMTPYHLTLTQSWFYQVTQGTSLIYQIMPITWSISTEVFFYVMYVPLSIPLVRLLTSLKRNLIAAIFILSWMMLWNSCIFIHGESIQQWAVLQYEPVADYRQSFLHWLSYYSPYARFGEFMLGAVAANIYLKQFQWRAGRGIIIACVMWILCVHAGGAFLLSLQQGVLISALYAPAIAILLLLYASTPSRILGSKPMIMGGLMSYSLYLLHSAFIDAVPSLAVSASGWEALLQLVARILLVLVPLSAFSYLTYRLIERPAQRALRRLM